MGGKVSEEYTSELNTEFVNAETGRRISLEQVVTQIIKGRQNDPVGMIKRKS